MTRKIQIEVFVDETWESSYSLNRESLDKVYRYMDLLQLEEIEGLDISGITDEITEAHDRSGM